MASFMQRGPGAERIVTRLWRPFTSILGATSHKPDVESRDHWEIRGRTVPRVMTDNMKSLIDAHMKYRELMDCKENMYVFAVPGCMSHVRHHDTLCELSGQCGAGQPHHLRSTGLRKHAAIISEIMSLPENDLDILANYLGHDVRIHREYYRLPDPTVLWVPM